MALLVIPPRCGASGIAAGLTIGWLGLTAIIVIALRQAQPRPGAPAFILSGALVALFGYPIVVEWIERRVDDPAAIAIAIGSLLSLVLVVAYRRVFLTSLLGPTRLNPIAEFRLIQAARRAARAEARRDIEAIKTQLRNRNSSNG